MLNPIGDKNEGAYRGLEEIKEITVLLREDTDVRLSIAEPWAEKAVAVENKECRLQTERLKRVAGGEAMGGEGRRGGDERRRWERERGKFDGLNLLRSVPQRLMKLAAGMEEAVARFESKHPGRKPPSQLGTPVGTDRDETSFPPATDKGRERVVVEVEMGTTKRGRRKGDGGRSEGGVRGRRE
eukprot:jgi/Undpi1/6832/HiC_scaffold_21.g09308.m1